MRLTISFKLFLFAGIALQQFFFGHHASHAAFFQDMGTVASTLLAVHIAEVIRRALP